MRNNRFKKIRLTKMSGRYRELRRVVRNSCRGSLWRMAKKMPNSEAPKIRFDHSIGYLDKGLDTLVQPWFDITDKLPFSIPNDLDSSDVFFFALYNPDYDSMKYVCSVVLYGDYGGSNEHEFELTVQEIALLKDGMEALCQREHNCSLKAYWESNQH